ncbi:MAG TPA: hypothetical protein VEH09_13780 [Thermodesulfobacteriota bacterium]|nr:hypothetical protein [Thermodesulfobacteriota bacterium]
MRKLRWVLLLSGFFLHLSSGWTQVWLEEVEEAPPFPPGKNAKLVKQVCAPCHSAEIVYLRVYDENSARKYYENMVGDPDSDQGRKVIEYLTTVLGFK